MDKILNIRVSSLNDELDIDDVELHLEERGWIVESLFIEQEEN